MAHPFKPTFRIQLQVIVHYDPNMYLPALEAMEPPPIPSVRDDMLANIVRKHISHELTSREDLASAFSETKDHIAWHVDGDKDIRSSSYFDFGNGEHSYCDVKITSPTHMLSGAALAQVEDMIKVLDRNFDILTDPAACGLHVHVGSAHRGFKLQVVKNFAILITNFESHFSSLHRPKRVLNNEKVRRQTANFEGLHPFEIAFKIQSCGNIRELVNIFGVEAHLPSTHLAYDLASLVAKPWPNEIEFRQHEATMDVDEVVWWVVLCCALVKYADEVTFQDLTQMVHDLAFDSRKTVVDVLRGLGLIEFAEYYSDRAFYEYSRHEKAWLYEPPDEEMQPVLHEPINYSFRDRNPYTSP